MAFCVILAYTTARRKQSDALNGAREK